MRLLIARAPLRRILRLTQWTLFAAGVSLLGYCAFAIVDARVFQQTERRQLERLTVRVSSTSPNPSPPVVAGGLIGRMEIPRLGLSVIVMEGTAAKTLRRAVGHIEGTPLPGQSGNVGLSGHRDTFFRPLRNIRPDDIITLTTLFGVYRYRVVSTRVVRPGDIAVLDPTRHETLTLVTCYPFYFVGPAPDRFIVRAARVT